MPEKTSRCRPAKGRGPSDMRMGDERIEQDDAEPGADQPNTRKDGHLPQAREGRNQDPHEPDDARRQPQGDTRKDTRQGFAGSSAFTFCHARSEEHTSELQSLMRISYAVFCLKKKNIHHTSPNTKPATKTI